MRSITLIETMLYDGNDIPLLKYHLKRIEAGIRFYGMSIDEKDIELAVMRYIERLNGKENYRVRLLITDGNLDLSSEPYFAPQGVLRVRLQYKDILGKINKQNWYYKTSLVVDLKKVRWLREQNEIFDIIGVTQQGYIIDGYRTNVYVQSGGKLYTPPVQAGVLAGVYRQRLIEQGLCEEKILTVEMLTDQTKVFVSNALIGLREVKII